MSVNTYSYPIEKKYIQKIDSETSPAHIRKVKNGVTWDLTHAVDFLCDMGLPIKAAFDGVVFGLRDNLKANYNKETAPTGEELPEGEGDGNFVVIKHANKIGRASCRERV